jgi:hypothetical protein
MFQLYSELASVALQFAQLVESTPRTALLEWQAQIAERD